MEAVVALKDQISSSSQAVQYSAHRRNVLAVAIEARRTRSLLGVLVVRL